MIYVIITFCVFIVIVKQETKKNKLIKIEHEKTLLEIDEYKKGNYPILHLEGFYLDKDEMGYIAVKCSYFNSHFTLLDNGHLALTNKRIIFIGNKFTRD